MQVTFKVNGAWIETTSRIVTTRVIEEVEMAFRYKEGNRKSKRKFSKYADLTHKKNKQSRATMKRGGYRM